MDCSEARSRFFELTPNGSANTEFGEASDVRRHLDGCAECRAEHTTELVFDRRLARTIRDVAVPADLEAKLIRKAALSQTMPAPQLPLRPALARRRWSIAAACAVGMLACLLFVVWMMPPAQMTLVQLETLVEQSRDAVAAPSASMLDRPSGWRHLSGIGDKSAHQVEARVGVVMFVWKPRGAASASPGRLWVIPAARLAGAESLPDLAAAEMQYRPETTHLVWQESGTVYLLELGDDVTGLRQLRDALVRSRLLA